MFMIASTVVLHKKFIAAGQGLEKATSTCLCCLCVWSARVRLLSPLALRVY